MASWQYDQSTESNLMKVKYGKLIDKQFNQENIIFGRMKKNEKFVGSQIEKPIIQSIGGGVSSGTLGTANRNQTAKAVITSKSVYAVVSVDRESMKASKTSEGAFVQFTKHPVQIAVRSFNRNLERMLTRNNASGAGILITGTVGTDSNVSGAGSAGDPYIISFNTASTYFPAEFECIEVGDILNADSEATELEVVDMTVTEASGYATGTISVVGSSVKLAADTGVAAFAESLYIQKSKDAEMIGLKGVLEATSGSLYSVSVGRRWQAYQKAAAAAALSTDLMNDVVINVKRRCGKAPKLILSSYHQFIKFLNILEDAKRYPVSPRDSKLKGKVSFSAIEYVSPDGVIPVMSSRFLDSDEMFFLNDDHMELNLRPGGLEWFDEDGTVFLRESGDSYEARYGGYGEFFVNPHFQGLLNGLAV